MDSNLKQTLTKFRQANDTRLENGRVVPLITKGIEPLSEESGTIQETPFIAQGTGTANNTSPVDTAPVGKQLEKQGNTICVNQDLNKNNYPSTDTINGITFTNNNDGTITISGTASATAYISLIAPEKKVGHKYLLRGCPSGGSGSSGYTLWDNQESAYDNGNGVIFTANSSSGGAYIRVANGTSIQTPITFKPNRIDLTQWFNGDIPTDLLNNPSHWSWYQNYGDYIAYNTGTLVNCAGRYLVNTGRQQWDEQWEIGEYGNTGAKVNSGEGIRSKNKIKIIPNTTYYFRGTQRFYICYYDYNDNFISRIDFGANTTRKSPSNAYYLTFNTASAYGTIYNHDITISLYYTTGDGYGDYYAYEQPKTYDTGVEVLRRIPQPSISFTYSNDLFDTKAPDGTIVRRVGYVDLSTLSWTQVSSVWVSNALATLIKKPESNNKKVNGWCSKLVVDSYANIVTNNTTGLCVSSSAGDIIINDSSITSSSQITGILYYELATPTTEQGTPFAENIEINDYGTMYWLDANNALVEIPQGTKLFYPAWYVGFIDSLGQRNDIEWDASNIVSQTELGVVDTKHDNLYAIMQENVGGALRHQLSGVDFANTKWIDLGTLTFNKLDDDYQHIVSATLTDISSSTTNAICPLYKLNNISYSSMPNMSMRISGTLLVIRNDNFGISVEERERFKNAMKGILLAYEKAS